MKLIIAGSRHLKVSSDFIQQILDKYGVDADNIISGGAEGIDKCGESYAYCCDLHIERFLPDYELYSSGRAPMIRNSKMAAAADALLVIWDGRSSGSQDMKNKMLELKKPVYEVIMRSYNG